jgi:hypothetical protein
MAVRVQDRSPVCIAAKGEKLPPKMWKLGKALVQEAVLRGSGQQNAEL